MNRLAAGWTIGLVLAIGPAWVAEASTGRQVPTETVIVPRDSETTIPGAPAVTPGSGEDASTPADGTLPAVEYDPEKLPSPVRRLREQLIESATTGDIEALRPIFEANPDASVGFGNATDPIEALRIASGDDEGREVLAILIEILQAGYLHVDQGTPLELYVWPYFYRYPLDALTPRQMVELFKIVTAGDLEDMRSFGAYNFFRLGISPDGELRFFMAGD